MLYKRPQQKADFTTPHWVAWVVFDQATEKSQLLCCSINIISAKKLYTEISFVQFGRFGLNVVQQQGMGWKRIQLLVGLLLKLPILITHPNSDCNFETEQKYLLQLHHSAEQNSSFGDFDIFRIVGAANVSSLFVCFRFTSTAQGKDQTLWWHCTLPNFVPSHTSSC